METRELEALATSYLLEGCRQRPSDIEKARKSFAVAYGFQRHLKNPELMELCIRLLASRGINSDEAIRLIEIGYETASTGIHMADAAAEFFRLNPTGR